MNKKRISIIIFIIGLAVLVAGVVFLIVKLTAAPSIADGEYLVSVGEWALEGENCAQLKCAGDTKCLGPNGEPMVQCENGGVIWSFTEIGKGTLTTNNHLNDYEFIWALEDGKLQVQTDWLYTLNNTYEYLLDQNSGTLTLTSGSETIKFVPASS